MRTLLALPALFSSAFLLVGCGKSAEIPALPAEESLSCKETFVV